MSSSVTGNFRHSSAKPPIVIHVHVQDCSTILIWSPPAHHHSGGACRSTCTRGHDLSKHWEASYRSLPVHVPSYVGTCFDITQRHHGTTHVLHVNLLILHVSLQDNNSINAYVDFTYMYSHALARQSLARSTTVPYLLHPCKINLILLKLQHRRQRYLIKESMKPNVQRHKCLE